MNYRYKMIYSEYIWYDQTTKTVVFIIFSNIFIQQQKEHMIRLKTMIAEISLIQDILYDPNINFNDQSFNYQINI